MSHVSENTGLSERVLRQESLAIDTKDQCMDKCGAVIVLSTSSHGH